MAKRPFADLPHAINMIGACIEERQLPRMFGDGISYEVIPAESDNWEVHRIIVDLMFWEEPTNDKLVALSLCPQDSDTPYNEHKLVRLRRARGQVSQPTSDGSLTLVLEAHTTIGMEKIARVVALPELVFSRTEGQRRRHRAARISRAADRIYWRSQHRYTLA